VYTQFEQHNQDFSDKAHAAAQSLVYPQLFKCDHSRLKFDSASVKDGGEKAILDGEMAVDRLVDVDVERLKLPLRFTVQERFRRPEYRDFRDMTITEWNHASDLPSELYKIKSLFVVYGYFFEEECCFGEVIVVNVAKFLMAMAKGDLSYGLERNKKKQRFIAIDFDVLQAAGVVELHIEETRPAAVLQTA
jgi:hypothetical protein